jgi:hypothetical protein
VSKVTSFDGIDIVIRTRNEHCEPHVHAFHPGQDWELRVFFSYVSSGVTEVDLYHGSTPKQGVVQAIMDKVVDHLDTARRLFWEAVQNVCLDNKYITVENGVARHAEPKGAGAIRVKTARYLPDKTSIEYIVHGTSKPMTAECP